jgi:GTP cyclohydrolase IA
VTPEARLTNILDELGISKDPEAVGTAARWLDVLREYAPKADAPALAPLVTASSDPLLLRDLPFHSLCVHHLLPFFGTADLVLRPRGRITGLGALVRVVDHFARQPQLQERLGAQIVAYVHTELGADVYLRLRARQMCVEMRGDRRALTVESHASAGDATGLAALLHG